MKLREQESFNNSLVNMLGKLTDCGRLVNQLAPLSHRRKKRRPSRCTEGTSINAITNRLNHLTLDSYKSPKPSTPRSKRTSKTPVKHQRHHSVVRPLSTRTEPLQPPRRVTRYSHKSRKGYAPDNAGKPNQDSCFAVSDLGGQVDTYVFGVCDGHGLNGHEVSSYVARRLPQLLAADTKLSNDPTTALRTAVASVNAEVTQLRCDTQMSGTTLVTVLIVGNTLYCANVGDSRAVLLRCAENWEAVALSRDHKPSLPNEQKRIEAAGGRVESFKAETGVSLGPARVWVKDQQFPGLAMSRALGDQVAASVGVTAEPEIQQHSLTDGDKFIVLGSDGLFEFLSNEVVLNLAVPYWKYGNSQMMSAALVNKAHSQWIRREAGIDDITALSVFLANAK